MSTSSSGDRGIQTAAATGGVTITAQTFDHSSTSSAMRTAGRAFNTDGTCNWRRTFSFVQFEALTDWIIPNTAASSSYDVRITNLNWVVKDEGFGISPSGGVWIDSVTTPTGGDSDGDEDTWFDLGTTREWTFVDSAGSGSGVGEQHAQFDFQIRRGTTVLATAAMDWRVLSGDGGGGGGGGCFMYGTEFRMADGSLKEVQDIVFGDVMEMGGVVDQTITGNGKYETWYGVDGVNVTGTHTICKDGEWMRVRAAGYPSVSTIDQYYVVANENHRMVAANGHVFGDYTETDYLTVEFGDWMIDNLNGKTNSDDLDKAVKEILKQN